MTQEEHEQLEELFNTLDDRAYVGFLVLKAILETKNKRVNKQDIHFLYTTYALLLVERKNYLETERKLLSLNNFYGLR